MGEKIDKLIDIIWAEFSKLPEEEQERRLQGLEAAVKKAQADRIREMESYRPKLKN